MPAACDKKDIIYLEKKEMRLFICGSFTSFQTPQYSQSQLIRNVFYAVENK